MLAGDLAGSNLLDGVNGSLGSLSNGLGRAGDGGVQKTSVGVDGTGGLDLGGGSGLGLAEDGEAGGPLDGGLATEQGAEDSNLGLVELAGEGAGAGEGNDEGVAAVVSEALLTAVVLGLLAALAELLEGRGRDVVEELANPLGELAVVGAVGDNGEVGLCVCALGKVLDGLGVEVLGVGGGRGRGGRVAEAAVEGEAVGRVDGHLDGAADEALVGEVDQGEDLLVVDVGCAESAGIGRGCRWGGGRTLVLCLAGDLAEELDKVGQVVAEELCLEDEVLARVVGGQGSSQQLGFADDAQSRPPLGGL